MVTEGEVRPGAAFVLGPVALAVVLVALVPFRGDLDRAVPALALVVPVLVAGIVGGRVPALATALISAVALNLFFVEPYGSFRVAVWESVVALVAFVGVAASVGTLSQHLGRRQGALAARAAELAEMREAMQAAADERESLQREARRLRELEATEEQRAAVLRSVSHDLRTPLATIRAITSDLRSGTEYDDATRNELLDIVGDEAERLDRLVANLLSLSRLEAGAMTPVRQAVDLDELLRERARRLARLFHQVRLVVDVPDDLPLVDGDYSQLDQLVTNLLENASRYAPSRSTVTVRATVAAGDPERIQLEVQDQGIGVPDHERSRIFEPFRGADATRSSGVGLATCRGIVEAHGGRIWVDRTPGGGATFFATLPIRKGRSGA